MLETLATLSLSDWFAVALMLLAVIGTGISLTVAYSPPLSDNYFPITYRQMTPDRLSALLREASAAHHTYETSQGVDPDWASWYARYIIESVKPHPWIDAQIPDPPVSLPDATGDSEIGHLGYFSWNPRSAWEALSPALDATYAAMMKGGPTAADTLPFTLLSTVSFPIAACGLSSLSSFLTSVCAYRVYLSDADVPEDLQGGFNDRTAAFTRPESKGIVIRDSIGGLPITPSGKLYLLIHETAHVLLHRNEDRKMTPQDRFDQLMGIPLSTEMRYEAEAELSTYLTLSALNLSTEIPLTYFAGRKSFDRAYNTPWIERLNRARSKAEPVAAQLVSIIRGTCDAATL